VPLTAAEIEAYVATGEPLQCAGGFALEGRGGALVERIEGCFSNVIGLSLPLLRCWLQALDHRLPLHAGDLGDDLQLRGGCHHWLRQAWSIDRFSTTIACPSH
jgi:hypothetical protein